MLLWLLSNCWWQLWLGDLRPCHILRVHHPETDFCRICKWHGAERPDHLGNNSSHWNSAQIKWPSGSSQWSMNNESQNIWGMELWNLYAFFYYYFFKKIFIFFCIFVHLNINHHLVKNVRNLFTTLLSIPTQLKSRQKHSRCQPSSGNYTWVHSLSLLNTDQLTDSFSTAFCST